MYGALESYCATRFHWDFKLPGKWSKGIANRDRRSALSGVADTSGSR